MRATSIRSAFAAIAACMASADALGAYRLVDLGPDVSPVSVNDSGVVVGGVSEPASTDPTAPPPPSHPFVWSSGVLTRIDVPGWGGGFLLDVNASGTAVGQLANGDPAVPTAPFIYRDGVVSLIPVPGIGAASTIDDGGSVGGFVQPGTPHNYGGNVPFVFAGGTLTLLPSLGGPGGGVTDISPGGVAVGALSTADGTGTVPFRWSGGSMSFLPAPGTNAIANAINSAGVIVGTSSVGTSFQSNLVVWQDGIARDLGSLGDALFTQGMSINDDGTIVGSAFGFSGANGFVYRDGAFSTLDALAPESGWHFVTASHVNSHGDIVGLGQPPGDSRTHGFLLIAEPGIPELIAQLQAAIADAGLGPSVAKGVPALLDAYVASGGANRRGLCNGLARLLDSLARADIAQDSAARVRDIATALAQALGC